jgi:chromosome segregation ATPase
MPPNFNSIKDAFDKVRADMDALREDINYLNNNINNLKEEMISICEIMQKVREENRKIQGAMENNDKNEQKIAQKRSILQKTSNSTDRQIIQTDPSFSSTQEKASTDTWSLQPLKTQNKDISIGNQGVPTDRQTDRQTDRHMQNEQKIVQNTPKIPENVQNIGHNEDGFERASEILNSLDSLKKEIRLKFKRLTSQEMHVFSTIYQLDEEQLKNDDASKVIIDYKFLSNRLNLSESSIRDYIGRLIKKGIPVDKTKINNKNIHLSISPSLKKIASLPTILQLVDL